MAEILSNMVLVNGVDIWLEYHAFLREEKQGDEENLTALLTPSKMKSHVAVNFREQDGEKYSDKLLAKSEARDVTLHFAIMADSKADFLLRYMRFVKFIKEGMDGWTVWQFPTLGLEMKMFCVEFHPFESLSNIWVESAHCGAFKVTLHEPAPFI